MGGKYIRQAGVVNQDRLAGSRVLVAGAGGLGCFVAVELVVAGVGTVHVVDNDVVEEHNLNRQFLYRESDVGKYKARVAEERLGELNGDVNVKGFVASWEDLDVEDYDVVFDCLDRWGEKKALAKRRRGITVTGSVGEGTGFVSVLAGKEIPSGSIREVRGDGVLGAWVGTVASIMAGEGIRELAGCPSPLRNRLLHINFKTMEFTLFGL